jgi:hypothetical protein
MRDLMGTGHIWFRMSTATRPKMPDLAQFAHRFPRRPADAFHTYEKAGRIAKWFWSVAEDCQVLLDPDCDPGAAERPPSGTLSSGRLRGLARRGPGSAASRSLGRGCVANVCIDPARVSRV